VCPGPVDTEILQINNQGDRVLEARPNIGPRGALSSARAAQIIGRALVRGRREIFLTWDTFLLAALHRHFPGFTLRLIRFFFQKKRDYFKKLVGQVNPDAV
jgi:short-subunit dehydrogenase